MTFSWLFSEFVTCSCRTLVEGVMVAIIERRRELLYFQRCPVARASGRPQDVLKLARQLNQVVIPLCLLRAISSQKYTKQGDHLLIRLLRAIYDIQTRPFTLSRELLSCDRCLPPICCSLLPALSVWTYPSAADPLLANGSFRVCGCVGLQADYTVGEPLSRCPVSCCLLCCHDLSVRNLLVCPQLVCPLYTGHLQLLAIAVCFDRLCVTTVRGALSG